MFKYLGYHDGRWMFGMNTSGMSGIDAHRVEGEVFEWGENDAVERPIMGNDGSIIPNGVKDGSILYVLIGRPRDVVDFEQKFETTGIPADALSSFIPARRPVAA
jgi:hypothetical protein